MPDTDENTNALQQETLAGKLAEATAARLGTTEMHLQHQSGGRATKKRHQDKCTNGPKHLHKHILHQTARSLLPKPHP